MPFRCLLSTEPIFCQSLRLDTVYGFGRILSDFSSFFYFYVLLCTNSNEFLFLKKSSKFKKHRQILPRIFLNLIFISRFKATFQLKLDLSLSTSFFISPKHFSVNSPEFVNCFLSGKMMIPFFLANMV